MEANSFEVTESFAKQLDEKDSLAAYKEEFYVKEKEYYMNGNSLGLLSKRSERAVLDALEDWKEFASDGWLQAEPAWFYMSEQLGKMTGSLIGAKKGETIVTYTTMLVQLATNHQSQI